MKINFNLPQDYKEFMFYANWYRKSKNLKTKRKLILKCFKIYKKAFLI